MKEDGDKKKNHNEDKKNRETSRLIDTFQNSITPGY